MKKAIIILSLILVSCNSGHSEKSKNKVIKSFTLKATVKNLKDSLSVILTKMDTKNFYGKRIDTTLSKNGSFKFQEEIDKPSEYQVMIIDYKAKVGKGLFLWLENGDISITGNFDDFENAKVGGSKLTVLSKEYSGISEKYHSQMQNGEIDYKDFQKGVHKEQLNFLFKNPNNQVSLSQFLYFTDKIGRDSLKLFYDKLDTNLKKSNDGIALKNSFEINKIKIGEPFINITAKDLNGNTVNLSDFRGKVIVLDFWAIWCHYCHEQNQEEFPKLKEKYKNEDFVIISYSIDVDKKDWEKSSKADNIDWVNISNLGGVKDIVVTKYGVEVYPTSFIINKERKVVKKMKGFENGLIEAELDKIFSIN